MAKRSTHKNSDQEPAVLGKGLHVVGHVRGAGDLRIEAQVEGEIAVVGLLHIDPTATVNGSVDVQSAVISGVLNGDIKAQGAVEITATGSVSGNVSAGQFSLEQGARFDGEVEADFDLPEAIA